MKEPQPSEFAEIVRRGQEMYDRHIRPIVEPGNTGKFLVLDIDTGEYEMDEDDLTASQLAEAKHPNSLLYTVKVGYPTAYRIGSSMAGKAP
jgi:hypothetical protein